MLQSYLGIQIDFLLLLQNFREVTNGIFDNFFLFITTFGEIIVPTLFISLIYWCFNSKYGMLILWNWSLGTIFCELLKNIACIYRPWILDNRIKPPPQVFEMASGYSFPSGHSQTAVSVWGCLANCFKNKILSVGIIVLIFLIAFSRLYLGVHTPQDVIVGILIGLITLYITQILYVFSEKSVRNKNIIILSVFLLSAFVLIFEHFKSYPMDYINNELVVNPVLMRMYAFPKVGLFLGIFTGWYLNENYLKFDGSKGSANHKIIRFIIGYILLALIFKYGKILFNCFMVKQYAMFCSSFLGAFFVTFLYPLFINLSVGKSLHNNDINKC